MASNLLYVLRDTSGFRLISETVLANRLIEYSHGVITIAIALLAKKNKHPSHCLHEQI